MTADSNLLYDISFLQDSNTDEGKYRHEDRVKHYK